MAELEEALHRSLFDVMLFGSGNGDAAALTASQSLLARHIALQDQSVARRFEAMRALLVLGRAVPAHEDARRTLIDQARSIGMDLEPDLPGDDALKLSLRNNHLLMQAAVLLALPEVNEGRELATHLTNRFMAQMTEDGMFPSELCRGASALWYANLAVMLLTTISALSQQDGAAPIVPPGVLGRAISGLGHALTFPPEVLWLARQNLYPQAGHGRNLTRPDTGFLVGYHRSRHYLAWVPVARKLLPDQAFPVEVSPDDRFPLANDFIGGFSASLCTLVVRNSGGGRSTS